LSLSIRILGSLRQCSKRVWDNKKAEEWREKGNIPETTTLQSSNQDLDTFVISETANDSAAIIEIAITGEIQERPAFGVADTANDTSELAELHVDDDLGFVSLNVPTSSGE
jgi:hypothetical protein